LDTNGIINLPRRFLHWWHATEYDKRFRNMCLAFSYTLPVFMANLALTTLIKFFEYQAVSPTEPMSDVSVSGHTIHHRQCPVVCKQCSPLTILGVLRERL
jgi:hypothetical protein